MLCRVARARDTASSEGGRAACRKRKLACAALRAAAAAAVSAHPDLAHENAPRGRGAGRSHNASLGTHGRGHRACSDRLIHAVFRRVYPAHRRAPAHFDDLSRCRAAVFSDSDAHHRNGGRARPCQGPPEGPRAFSRRCCVGHRAGAYIFARLGRCAKPASDKNAERRQGVHLRACRRRDLRRRALLRGIFGGSVAASGAALCLIRRLARAYLPAALHVLRRHHRLLRRAPYLAHAAPVFLNDPRRDADQDR